MGAENRRMNSGDYSSVHGKDQYGSPVRHTNARPVCRLDR
jgi:hypothetical protein